VTMYIVFRADASVMIGTGHIMRCLTLADELRARGAECHFISRMLPGHLGALIERRGFAVSLLDAPSGDALSFDSTAHAKGAGVTWEQDLAETRELVTFADWLIVDHYSFDYRWQKGLADRAKRIMVIDDLADRQHFAALLLDQNLGRKETDYDGLVPNECNRLIGLGFALLRPEFGRQRNQSLQRRMNGELSHLLISMGGTDAIDATSAVLRVIHKARLPKRLRLSEVLVDVGDMARLMASADFSIGAGGSTTWERCCLGLPSIIVETAANQNGAAAAMQKAGAALVAGPLLHPAFSSKLVQCMNNLLESGVSARISRRSAELCFGDGVVRVADLM